MRKSQKVFDEVGYNLSETVKGLILSLDSAPGTATDDVDISEKDAEIADLKGKLDEKEAEVAELRARISSFEDNDAGEDTLEAGDLDAEQVL